MGLGGLHPNLAKQAISEDECKWRLTQASNWSRQCNVRSCRESRVVLMLSARGEQSIFGVKPILRKRSHNRRRNRERGGNGGG